MTAFGKGCMVGFGGCACGSSSVAANHRQVAVAHPRLVDYNVADNNDTYNDGNDNSAQPPLKQLRFPSVLIESQTRFDAPVDKLPTQPLGPNVPAISTPTSTTLSTTKWTATSTTYKQRRRLTSKRKRQLNQQPAIINRAIDNIQATTQIDAQTQKAIEPATRNHQPRN